MSESPSDMRDQRFARKAQANQFAADAIIKLVATGFIDSLLKRLLHDLKQRKAVALQRIGGL